MSLVSLRNEIKSVSNPDKAKFLQRFFKTGKGEYAEGDVFLGIVVPVQRQIAKKYKELSFIELKVLITSKYHEERLIALLILVERFKKADENEKEIIVKFYLDNRKGINNWDLVDLSAPKILGQYLIDKDRKILFRFAKSNDLWAKRIAVLSTFAFIRNNDFEDALKIYEILVNDKHDLIHKAVGWMLRELGKIDLKEEEEFLKKHYKTMPRTMLRYAIEKFPERKRKAYLEGRI
ncbi:MAG: DNA alkylation repair protein [Ignavibacterium sp.]|nr:DNA alkylation repair protein [Ignavibacterium sp.]